MQESKEIGPHVTTREELDALYKNIKKSLSEKEDHTDASSDNEEK
jgi:hypothetical protein